jgi:hypothetical protein
VNKRARKWDPVLPGELERVGAITVAHAGVSRQQQETH